ncbi:lantibiotic dehydratase [Streptomyces sp. NPDC007983]|uniref:lantibiotic dehydratase n=1 Tax=Streptomyces sp. NPDC007983 TaxID=3364800 RepID=UPI0036E4593A
MTTSLRTAPDGLAPEFLPGDGWVTLPHFVLRMSGFPFELLKNLVSDAATGSAKRLVRARHELDRAMAASHAPGLLASARTRADGAALRAMRKRKLPSAQIRADVASAEIANALTRFAVLLDEEAAAEKEFLTLFPEEELRTSGYVLDLFRHRSDLRDGLLVSNESSEPVLAHWIDKTTLPGWRWHKDDRPRIDTLVRHLQRAGAKNDTTGHLGPFAPGLFAADTPGLAAVPTGLNRHPLLARWAADAIAVAMRKDPHVLPQCRPRRAPGASLTGRTLHVFSFDYTAKAGDVAEATRIYRPVDVGDYDCTVLSLCDGERTAAQIAQRIEPTYQPGDPVPPPVADSLHRLEDLGAILVGPEIPYGTPDPLPQLAAYEGDPGGVAWRGLLREAERRLTDFGAADSTTAERRAALDALKCSFEAHTGISAERGQGKFYGDRSVLHEDCSGRYDGLSLGGPLTDLLAGDLTLAYELAMAAPRQRYTAESQLLAVWHARRFAGRPYVSLHEFIAGFVEDHERLTAEYARVDVAETTFLDRVEDALLARGTHDDTAVSVDTATVRELVAAAGAHVPMLCNPDLMIAAESEAHLASGDFFAVISELHANEESLSHGLFGPVLNERFPGFPDAVLEGYRGLMTADEDLACVTLAHRNKSYIRVPLDTVEIEASGRSPLPRQRVFALADLQVVNAGNTLRLRHPGSGRFLRMAALPYAWLGVRHNPFVPFGFPRHQGGKLLPGRRHPHLPRITMASVVLQREFWRIPAEELAARHRRDAFLKVQRVREERGLVRHLYAKVPGETKPIYCDLDSPLLVRQLTRLAGQSAEPVELSEMLPGPEHLWVSDQHGHYTSELRYAAFSAPVR